MVAKPAVPVPAKVVTMPSASMRRIPMVNVVRDVDGARRIGGEPAWSHEPRRPHWTIDCSRSPVAREGGHHAGHRHFPQNVRAPISDDDSIPAEDDDPARKYEAGLGADSFGRTMATRSTGEIGGLSRGRVENPDPRVARVADYQPAVREGGE